MGKETKTCAECGIPIGDDVGVSVYKHTVSCFHLKDLGKEQVIKEFSDNKSDYAQRILQNLGG